MTISEDEESHEVDIVSPRCSSMFSEDDYDLELQKLPGFRRLTSGKAGKVVKPFKLTRTIIGGVSKKAVKPPRPDFGLILTLKNLVVCPENDLDVTTWRENDF